MHDHADTGSRLEVVVRHGAKVEDLRDPPLDSVPPLRRRRNADRHLAWPHRRVDPGADRKDGRCSLCKNGKTATSQFHYAGLESNDGHGKDIRLTDKLEHKLRFG